MDRRNFLAATGGAALTAAGSRPNILMVITDQQSADAMSCRLGRRYLNTPAMDSLAGYGTVYTRAYCANPLCIPSRTSMFTGRYPVETGVQTNDKTRLDHRRFPVMGSIFRSAGYATPYFGKWHLPYDADAIDTHGFSCAKLGKGDDGIAAAAAAFLRTRHDKPFLAVVSFVNPHNICQWARREPLPDGPIGAPPPVEQCPPRRPNHAPQLNEPDIVSAMRRSYQKTRTFPVGRFTEKDWREYIWAYYRMIEKVDGLIGQVLGALRQAGLERDTLVVFLADHGDCQGAHGWNQKTVFYEEAARVPLILSLRGVTKSGVSDRLVHTGVDLIPTLCGYAGIPVPAGLPGVSLKDAKDPRESVVVSNRMVQGAPGDPTPEGRMVRSRRFKYCVYSEGNRRESLVDLDKDPGEMVNLAGDPQHAPILAGHRKLLSGWRAQTGDRGLGSA